jgi:hypothetical protein
MSRELNSVLVALGLVAVGAGILLVTSRNPEISRLIDKHEDIAEEVADGAQKDGLSGSEPCYDIVIIGGGK